MILIALQKLASSDATESGSMFDKPAFFSKRQSSHCVFACFPIDQCDQSWGKVVLLLPVSFGKRGEGILVDSILVHS